MRIRIFIGRCYSSVFFGSVEHGSSTDNDYDENAHDPLY